MNVVKKVELDRVPDPARRPVPEEKLVPALEKGSEFNSIMGSSRKVLTRIVLLLLITL